MDSGGVNLAKNLYISKKLTIGARFNSSSFKLVTGSKLMSESELDAKQIEKKVSDLAEAMEQVRDNQATKDDVVVDMKQATHGRLEMLAQDLQPVFQELPSENDQFEFSLTDGETPRLWIDMTSFVRMGRDRGVFEFIKDTRMGRTILAQSDDREKMAKMVTSYVAERILERERMIEGEWHAMRDYNFGVEEEETADEVAPVSSPKKIWQLLGLFAAGLLIGAAVMVLWAWFGDLPSGL